MLGAKFPRGLPAAIRASAALKAVSPGLGDSMARMVERIVSAPGRTWVRPAALRSTPSVPEPAPKRHPQPDAATHTTLWLPIGADHPILAAAGFKETAHVPVFLDGPEYKRFRASRQLDVSAKALLFGAVIHMYDEPPGVDVGAFRARLANLFDVMARGFQQPDLELLLVNVAANVRELHGGSLSRRALENVVRLRPDFDRARSDLVVDIWQLSLKSTDAERPELLQSLLEHFRRLDRTKVIDGSRAMVCYAAVAGTAALRGPAAGRRLLAELRDEIACGNSEELLARLTGFMAEQEGK